MKLRSVSGNHVMLPLSLIRAGVKLLESLFPVESSLKDFSEITVSCDFAPRAISSRNIRIEGAGMKTAANGIGIAAFDALKNVSHDISRARVEAQLHAIKSEILESSPGIERYGLVETKILETRIHFRDSNNWFSRSQQKSLVQCSPETRYLLMFYNGPQKDAVQRRVNDSSFAAVHFDFAVEGGGLRFLAPQLQHCLISVADLGRPVD
mgnify:CR=1 FL=1